MQAWQFREDGVRGVYWVLPLLVAVGLLYLAFRGRAALLLGGAAIGAAQAWQFSERGVEGAAWVLPLLAAAGLLALAFRSGNAPTKEPAGARADPADSKAARRPSVWVLLLVAFMALVVGLTLAYASRETASRVLVVGAAGGILGGGAVLVSYAVQGLMRLVRRGAK